MASLKTVLCGVEMKNPVITASGTFGFGREYRQFYPLSELGALTTKALTLRPREGNPPPRVAETPLGMLNSIGLQNPGVEKFISEELPFLRKFDVKVIVNIAGNSVEENAELARILSDAGADMIELNVSCPNVKEGGIAFGSDPEMLRRVVHGAKNKCTVPLAVKLSPNVTDIVSMAKIARDAGADALSLVNTLLGMRIDTQTRRPILGNITGGLSGPAIFPVALRAVYEVHRALPDVPIIGMGGVDAWEPAVEMFIAGANAVAVGTASFKNPMAPVEIRDGIGAYLERTGLSLEGLAINGSLN